jgi:hypothetical protein
MWANHLEDTVGVSQTVLPLKLAASVATLTAQADWHCLANTGTVWRILGRWAFAT